MSRNLLPHQLSEATFRFYEPYIKEGIDRFPNDIAWDISLLPPEDRRAPTTFVARFRDAITSLRKNSWPTTINVDKLMLNSGKYCIWWEPGTTKIWFKTRSQAGKPAHHKLDSIIPHDPAAFDALRAASAGAVPWGDATEEEMRALAVLLDKGRLTGIYEVKGGPLSDEVEQRIMSGLTNVFVRFDPDRSLTIFN